MSDAILPKNPRFKNLSGKTFSKLTVVSFHSTKNKKSFWTCKCECGNITTAPSDQLYSGHKKSCGCNKKIEASRIGSANKTHGMNKTPTHRSWNAMLDRCNNPLSKDFPRYGGRGILVCEQWRVFEAFLEDMGVRPGKSYSIDRIDVNGNYCKENCRWATSKEQAKNRRNNARVMFRGESRLMIEVAEELNMSLATLKTRRRKGWSDEAIVSPPWKYPKNH